jgi:hypothetical protein
LAVQLQVELEEAVAFTKDALQSHQDAVPSGDAGGDAPAVTPVASDPTPSGTDAIQRHDTGSLTDQASSTTWPGSDTPSQLAVKAIKTKGNSKLHPENFYFEKETDFAQLAVAHPQLQPHLTIHPGELHMPD